jgi:heme A synthase
MVDIQLAHRIAIFLAVLAIAALAWLLRRQRFDALALAIALVTALQVWLGAMNVWLGESGALVVAHLAVATLLWLLLVVAFFLTSPHLETR